MKFTVFSLVTLIFVGTVAANVAKPVAAPVAARDIAFDDALIGRSADECRPSPGCFCNHVQGEFCGNERINRNCRNGYVYECNAETGRTCVYGIRDSCVRCGELECSR